MQVPDQELNPFHFYSRPLLLLSRISFRNCIPPGISSYLLLHTELRAGFKCQLIKNLDFKCDSIKENIELPLTLKLKAFSRMKT